MSNLPTPDFTKKQKWAAPIAKTDDGIIFKVQDTNSNYWNMIFTIVDKKLSVYESEEDRNQYIDYEYHVDQSPGSKIHRFGAHNFEKEMNAFLLELITEEIEKNGEN